MTTNDLRTNNNTIKYMKRTLLLAALTALGSTAAFAQVDVTLTGSTSFRAITIDRAWSILDNPGRSAITNDAATGLIRFAGTMSNAAPTLGSTPVVLRLSFSGSAAGMIDVRNQNPVNVVAAPGEAAAGVSNMTRIPDLALSDVFPASATPPIPQSAFDRSVLGVIPFVYVRNNTATNVFAGVTNLTQSQANLLMVASGFMPATFLGGNSSRFIYMTGRDSESGTRISVEKCIGFVGSPLLWTTNAAGVYINTNGLTSGGIERGVIQNRGDVIGYLGVADFNSISNSAATLPFNGVPFSHTNVVNGSYSIWGYEHIVNRVGGLSTQKQAVRGALISAISNPQFQATNTLYNVAFTAVSEMHVERGSDGGTITSLDF
jgi:hypothetical protein